MKRLEFEITISDLVGNITVKNVYGYCIEYGKYKFGLHKSFNHWNITELSTGAYICTGLKRMKDAIPWLDDNGELLNKLPEILNSERGQKLKRAMHNYRLSN